MKKSWIRTTCTKRTRNRSIVEAFRDSIRITNARNNETNEIIPSLPRLWEFVDDAEKKKREKYFVLLVRFQRAAIFFIFER